MINWQTWKCGLDTHRAICLKRGSITFWNCGGSIASKISSISPRNITFKKRNELLVFKSFTIITNRKKNTGFHGTPWFSAWILILKLFSEILKEVTYILPWGRGTRKIPQCCRDFKYIFGVLMCHSVNARMENTNWLHQ